MSKILKHAAVAVIEREKTNDELVEEIHTAFLTEVDDLLKQAKVFLPVNTNEELIAKAKRLKALGFTSTTEVTKANDAQHKEREIEKENNKRKNLVDAINYFSERYPLYKFITQESVNRICEKYGLVYGEISRYKGTVPDKNLEQIEQFVVQENDECYVELSKDTQLNIVLKTNYLTKDRHDRIQAADKARLVNDDFIAMLRSSTQRINMKCPLEIAAPLKDFDTVGMEVINYKLQNKPIPKPVVDPVVLKPVIFDNTKYYLIVTAWGKEAEDEIVVNPKHQ